MRSGPVNRGDQFTGPEVSTCVPRPVPERPAQARHRGRYLPPGVPVVGLAFLMLTLYCLISSRNSAGNWASPPDWTLSRSFLRRLMNVPSPVAAVPVEPVFLSLSVPFMSPSLIVSFIVML